MNKTEEKKVLYVLVIAMVAIIIAYYTGKKLGRYLKNNETQQILIELRK